MARLSGPSFQRGIEILGHRFAADAARSRTNGCTYDGADRAKTDSNRVCTRRASNRVEIRPDLSRGVIVHVVLPCTVKEEATISGRVNIVCTVPHANEGLTTPVKGRAKQDASMQLIAGAKTARVKAMMQW
jgi:hypothetical protein